MRQCDFKGRYNILWALVFPVVNQLLQWCGCERASIGLGNFKLYLYLYLYVVYFTGTFNAL